MLQGHIVPVTNFRSILKISPVKKKMQKGVDIVRRKRYNDIRKQKSKHTSDGKGRKEHGENARTAEKGSECTLTIDFEKSLKKEGFYYEHY